MAGNDRFQAVGATFAQKDPASIPALVHALLEEESVRVKAKIAEGLAANGWAIPEDDRDAVRKVLPHQFGVDGEGKITRRG